MRLWNDHHLQLSITRLGLEYLAAMLLVGIFSVNTGNNLLYLVFSLMVALFLVSGWASRRALQHLAVDRIEEGNIFARVRGGIRLRLADAAPGRIRALEVRLSMEHGRIEPGFYAGGEGRGDALVVLHARPERRGACRLQTLELRTAYPFGFLEKARRFSLNQEILVLPHPRVATLPSGLRGDALRPLARPGTSAPEGARPFREGDPLGRVHWKRTAQRGSPWVRTFEDEELAGLHLHLDLRAWGSGRAFERELEQLSGAILQARLQKREVFLEILTRRGRRETQGFIPCWRALAMAQGEADGPAFSDAPTDSASASLAPRLT